MSTNTMKTILLLVAVLACCMLLTSAAPAGDQSVQFLKYSNDQELEEIQRQIIAQYEQLGGSSQFHQVQSAGFVNPNTVKISI